MGQTETEQSVQPASTQHGTDESQLRSGQAAHEYKTEAAEAEAEALQRKQARDHEVMGRFIRHLHRASSGAVGLAWGRWAQGVERERDRALIKQEMQDHMRQVHLVMKGKAEHQLHYEKCKSFLLRWEATTIADQRCVEHIKYVWI
jgi:hypothetical protein